MTLGLAMALVNAISDYRAKKRKEDAEKRIKDVEDAKASLDEKVEETEVA